MRMASLERDGWQLENAEVLAAAHPAGFDIPAVSERASLSTGTLVKLVFQIGFVDDDGESFIQYQQLWAAVAGSEGRAFRGALMEEPFLFAHSDEALRFGAPVTFTPGHVVQVMRPDDISAEERALVDSAIARAFPDQRPAHPFH